MSSFNKVILMGNLTRDVEMKYMASGTAVAKLGIACNRKYKDTKTNELREEVTYVDVEAFGKQAETLNTYMAKGKSIFIEGRLKLDSWDDKTSGKKMYKLKVVLENFQFLGGTPATADQTANRAAKPVARPAPARPAAPAPTNNQFEDEGPVLDIPEENIPF